MISNNKYIANAMDLNKFLLQMFGIKVHKVIKNIDQSTSADIEADESKIMEFENQIKHLKIKFYTLIV